MQNIPAGRAVQSHHCTRGKQGEIDYQLVHNGCESAKKDSQPGSAQPQCICCTTEAGPDEEFCPVGN